MSYTAIILAGGKSSRMGEDKGFCSLHSLPMIQHVLNNVHKANVSDTIIISNNSEYNKFGFPVFSDIYPDKGPLGGIFTGLSYSKSKNNLILSCDIPFVDHSVLELLMNQSNDYEINIVKFNNKIHPLIGTYHVSNLKDIEEHLLHNRLKMMDFLDTKQVNYLEIEKELPHLSSQVFENINTKKELNKYE